MPRVYTPFPYQRAMVDFILEHKRCGIWAGMGLGKTSSALTAIEALQYSGTITGPALVLAPLRVARSTWPDEAAKWQHTADMEVVPIIGDAKQRTAALARLRQGNAAIATINYENIPWLVEAAIEDWPFAMAVADEATRLKSFRLGGPNGVRARSLARVAHQMERWINLTGTPSPNGLQDLWGQQWFCDGGVALGRTFTAFQQRWFTKDWSGFGMIPLPTAEPQIHARVAPLNLAIDPADHFDLDEPIRVTVEVELPAKARRLYDAMEREMYMELGGEEVEAFGAAARTIKCLQLCNGAAYLGDADDPGERRWSEIHGAKLEALDSIIAEAAGAPVLVAYHFKSDIARLRKAYPHGRLLDQDPQTIRDWNEGRIPLMFAHPASAGHGLNLQDGGNIIAFFGLWWNLEEHMQIIERIGPVRQKQAGHDRPVFIYSIVAKDTVDALVLARMTTKRSVQDLLLEAAKKVSVGA
jgi:SNF2 family DNA or RNA helicase